MVTELADITVPDGTQADFEIAFDKARELLATVPGCRSARLLRGIESPQRFVLLIEWATIEDHMERFRSSEDFGRWRALVGPFFAAAPIVEHFETIEAAADQAGPRRRPPEAG